MSTPSLDDHAEPVAGLAPALVAEVKRAVDARLHNVVEGALRDAVKAGSEPAAMVDALAGLVRRGGKRLRPALVAAAYAASGRSLAPLPSALVDVGVAFELLQAYFLVHDDWMDGDRERRGGPSVHAALEARHGNPHLGASLAVLAGDLASGLAHEVLAAMTAPAGVVVRVMREFARMEQMVVLGQSLDLTLGADADPDAVDRMHARKTGSYTVRGPLLIGALLGEASQDVVAALDRFGAPLGIAFQLRDDLLGTFGDPSETGKPVGSDLRAGKRTALVASALARCAPADRVRLQAILADATHPARLAPVTDEDIGYAMQLFETCGARAALEARIDALAAEARAALFGLPPDAVELLLALEAAMVQRSR